MGQERSARVDGLRSYLNTNLYPKFPGVMFPTSLLPSIKRLRGAAMMCLTRGMGKLRQQPPAPSAAQTKASQQCCSMSVKVRGSLGVP